TMAADQPHGVLDIVRFAGDLAARLAAQHLSKPFPKHLVILDDDHLERLDTCLACIACLGRSDFGNSCGRHAQFAALAGHAWTVLSVAAGGFCAAAASP